MCFKKILVAIDYSPLSQAVFEQALDLAKTNDAQLFLFHCLTADTVTLSAPVAGEFGLPPQLMNQAYQSEFVRLEQQIQHMHALLRHYCNLAYQHGVVAESGYRTTEPGQGLCQAAQQWGADLIVVGRRGRKGLTEALLGSVSNYVLHHAPCAVLTIQATHDPSTQALSEPAKEVSSVG
ncbi:MAG: universal stress protein [Elainellaceae cyanobacterium]